ncbi:MAG: energy transducer TonB [Candidatus Acidiferrum sp.]
MMLENEKPKLRNIATCIFLAIALTLSAVDLAAQEGRKVIANPVPAYPAMAKNFHVTGVVKMQVVIAADGHIKSTQVIGGHPVLVDAVKETLKSWKYAPASSESTIILEFDFHP